MHRNKKSGKRRSWDLSTSDGRRALDLILGSDAPLPAAVAQDERTAKVRIFELAGNFCRPVICDVFPASSPTRYNVLACCRSWKDAGRCCDHRLVFNCWRNFPQRCWCGRQEGEDLVSWPVRLFNSNNTTYLLNNLFMYDCENWSCEVADDGHGISSVDLESVGDLGCTRLAYLSYCWCWNELTNLTANMESAHCPTISMATSGAR